MAAKRVLVFDEESARRRVNVFGLRCAGFAADEAEDAAGARAQIASRYPHVIVIVAGLLDLALQDFVRALRTESRTREIPVVVLVERESELDAQSALAWGIDDFMREPITPEEFVARVRATMERREQVPASGGDLASIHVDNDNGLLCKGERAIAAGPTERRLFELLLTHSGQLMPRELLLFRIWGGGMGLHSRVLDVSICRLRRALEKLECAGILQTVSRRGYRLSMRAAQIDERSSPTQGCNDSVTSTNLNARRA